MAGSQVVNWSPTFGTCAPVPGCLYESAASVVFPSVGVHSISGSVIIVHLQYWGTAVTDLPAYQLITDISFEIFTFCLWCDIVWTNLVWCSYLGSIVLPYIWIWIWIALCTLKIFHSFHKQECSNGPSFPLCQNDTYIWNHSTFDISKYLNQILVLRHLSANRSNSCWDVGRHISCWLAWMPSATAVF